ncbi:hypothetical protein CCM_07788 [Cordyceps militaris CM01]|uniref:Uncharacterized protein n=2 Tax=Cordyceps militaris TaxID=73501 RepID=G3JQN2_CORMM|nr:uncharacterized protein CCM_07788 [Cordyceps militaris CM01]ATY63062.1 hypothetical protein A9K55_007229 [Cordyceps militaris]EGX89536.1 hypothetical protein CCM_07788 [Cordyceps militaris CM01]
MRPANHVPGSTTLFTVFALLNGIIVPVRAADESSSSSASDSKSSSASSSSSKASASATESKSSSSSSPSATSTPSSAAASASSTDGAGLTGLPTLTNFVPIPTYAQIVPDTKDAPFMQSSSAPEGTVFIAVGAILGAFFLAVLIWRAIVSLLLHRSVERASKAQHAANIKKSSSSNAANFPAPPAPFYKYTDQESTRSLGQSARRTNRRSTRGPDPANDPSRSSLFFSPTAASGGPGNRGSTYLPSGFYAAGSAAPPHQQGQSISMSNLSPVSYANGSRHTLNGSPPESPMFHARRDASTSSVNLASPLQPGQRAPSAYLEDLLAEDPSAFPPPNMPGSRR